MTEIGQGLAGGGIVAVALAALQLARDAIAKKANGTDTNGNRITHKDLLASIARGAECQQDLLHLQRNMLDKLGEIKDLLEENGRHS